MGFLQNLFGKQNCTLCSAECGPMHRTKIQDQQFVCSSCVQQCSRYVQLYKMNKEEVQEHIEYMKKQHKLYTDVFQSAEKDKIGNTGGIIFSKDLGMFAIDIPSDSQNKTYQELFRFDQVESYEPYQEFDNMTSEGEKPKLAETGVILRFVSPKRQPAMVSEAKSTEFLHMHPYIEDEIKVVMAKNDREFDQAKTDIEAVIRTFDRIFGKEERALFHFGMDNQEKRQLAAGVSALKGAGAMLKAMKNGEDLQAVAAEQIEATGQKLNEMSSRGLSEYSQKADAAEKKAWD